MWTLGLFIHILLSKENAPSSDVLRYGLSKFLQKCAIYIYYLGQMHCFRTKNSIRVTPDQLTHGRRGCAAMLHN